MTDFKVGDRVKVISTYYGHMAGREATVIGFPYDGEFVSVILDDESSAIPYTIRRDSVIHINDLETPQDSVNPAHYKFGDVEVIEITRHLGFLEGNVVKYVTRAGRKGDRLEDLKKARKYLEWAIESAEKE